MTRDAVDEVIRALPISRRRRHAIARELRAHLDETQRELELAGWQPEAARREALVRLGDPAEIAEDFTHVYRPPRRVKLGLAFGLAGALLLGAYGASGTLASATSSHHRGPTSVTVVRHHVTQRSHSSRLEEICPHLP